MEEALHTHFSTRSSCSASGAAASQPRSGASCHMQVRAGSQGGQESERS